METLLREHELIEQVVGSLMTWATRLDEDRAPVEDGRGFLYFFRVYAGDLHHAREEDVLFPALVKEAELPGERGPVAVILAEHHEMAELLSGIESIVESTSWSAAERTRCRELAFAYANRLLPHIDAENSVLIPESEARLKRVGIHELEVRVPTDDERSAESTGRRLVELYPPSEDPDLIRGDGCVMCSSYGVRCEGLEREWWNDYEWEESDEHIASS